MSSVMHCAIHMIKFEQNIMRVDNFKSKIHAEVNTI